jgi:hypothetical protein
MKPILSQEPARWTVEQGVVTHRCSHWLHVHDLNLLTATTKNPFYVLYGAGGVSETKALRVQCF